MIFKLSAYLAFLGWFDHYNRAFIPIYC